MRIVSAVAPQYERANGPLLILVRESLDEIADRAVAIVRPSAPSDRDGFTCRPIAFAYWGALSSLEARN